MLSTFEIIYTLFKLLYLENDCYIRISEAFFVLTAHFV